MVFGNVMFAKTRPNFQKAYWKLVKKKQKKQMSHLAQQNDRLIIWVSHQQELFVCEEFGSQGFRYEHSHFLSFTNYTSGV